MKTWKSLILASALICFASCSVTKNYIQIAQTLPNDPEALRIDEEGRYYYQDENCKIVFDLWDEGGASNFTFYNLSDEALILCPNECLIAKNKYTNDMFTEFKNGAVAPHAYREFSGIKLGYKRITDCDFSILPKPNAPSSMSYRLSSSPARFRFYLTYKKSTSGEKKGIDLAFYISRVSNYLKSDILQYSTTMESEVYCENVPYSSNRTYSKTQYKYLFSPATGFYINYSATSK